MKTIIVRINPDGTAEVEAVGFKGKTCEKATAAIEEALGKVTRTKKKPEWHATAEVNQGVGS